MVFLYWLMVVDFYWMFNFPVLRSPTPVQFQPVYVWVGPARACLPYLR